MAQSAVESDFSDLRRLLSRTTPIYSDAEERKSESKCQSGWQIAAENVKFKSPALDEYLKNPVKERVLIIFGLSLSHTFKFQSMIIYEPESNSLPLDKFGKKFARLVVLLPSDHTGGQIVLEHRTEKVTTDLATDSAFNPLIISWFSEAIHQAGPIISGWRVALFYSFAGPTVESKPQAPKLDRHIDRLKDILLRWKEDIYRGILIRQGFWSIHWKKKHPLKKRMLENLEGKDALTAVCNELCTPTRASFLAPI
ncbi:hypothetical protein M422DRAFT_250670 [Sphaerobolus stellatus SS14]|uniref:Prolyl 4-hydroxylase alpha subunit Fe(2+) 2OG dioxygenase domain-containing protein n=1 Tax=Sphaerobolus stellatus (strain SS14) TaxID=990650 RepID=A0A0C9VFY9_SPHS4|nr:hypothetical protein M422DRAFT_250670 [Sphaerobolus stellatus SS14]